MKAAQLSAVVASHCTSR